MEDDLKKNNGKQPKKQNNLKNKTKQNTLEVNMYRLESNINNCISSKCSQQFTHVEWENKFRVKVTSK